MAEVLRTLAGKPKCHALRPMILFLIMLVLVLFGLRGPKPQKSNARKPGTGVLHGC
nr:truncated alpha 1-3-N-acetylgalactosaminyltransferase [Homo sapiens]